MTLDPEPLLHYVRLRREVQARRGAGGPAPWSDDPVLASRHFCCVIRDDDRTSREARATIQALPPEQGWAAALTFRLYNRPGTLDALLAAGAYDRGADEACRVLEALPMVFNTVAYRITLEGGLWNLGSLARAISRGQRMARRSWRPREQARHAVAQLQGELGIGPFLAYQVMQDLRWVGVVFEDEQSWCLLGGGAVRGITRLQGQYSAQKRVDYRFDHNTISGKDQGVLYQRHQADLLELLAALRELEPRANMFELEHNLCEYDKFERVRSGETGGRRWRPRL